MGIHPVSLASSVRFTAAIFTLSCALIGVGSVELLAQVLGDDAELERLQVRADEAIGGGDADGAAMNSGKAALLASQLARSHDGTARQTYLAKEALFRAQEQAYRAAALFHRAGGQPPASSGVCGMMSLAVQHLSHAHRFLTSPAGPSTAPAELTQSVNGWDRMVHGMIQDFQCP